MTDQGSASDEETVVGGDFPHHDGRLAENSTPLGGLGGKKMPRSHAATEDLAGPGDLHPAGD